ncbi:MAG: transcriptional regulator, PaaX family [Marmoricola sp.]|nr:transcriptional regulator, PaaX family [Marmoricola sp.]
MTPFSPIIPHEGRGRTIRSGSGYGRLTPVHARSALFDLYGDHVRNRGGGAAVAAIIRILEPLGVTAPATRTAISRMVMQDWLAPDDFDEGPGYRLTERGMMRLDEAAARIYRTSDPSWDGHWQVRVLAPIGDRARRERVRNQLRFLGMAPISDSTWVSPRHSAEVDRLLAEESVEAVALTSADVHPPAALLAAFDVDSLGAAYSAWVDEAATILRPATARTPDDMTAFVVRSELLHSWRKFLFTDPGLPAVLLPPDWAGHRAAAFFDDHAARLLPAATRFIDHYLAPTGTPP